MLKAYIVRNIAAVFIPARRQADGDRKVQEIGKILIIFGIILISLGLLLTFINKIPFLGKLPGDIYIQKKNFTFYFPLATSILISIILSLIFWLWSRR
jgi:uncharacterized membrane protein